MTGHMERHGDNVVRLGDAIERCIIDKTDTKELIEESVF